MAGKSSDRGVLEPQAKRLYTEGFSLSSVAETLGLAPSTIGRWFKENERPDGQNEWDIARLMKRSTLERMRELLDRQLKHVESTPVESVTAPMVDALSKMAAMIERLDKVEKTRVVAEGVVATVKKAGLSDEAVDQIKRDILGIAT